MSDIYISTSPFGTADPSCLEILRRSGFSFRQNDMNRKHTPDETCQRAMESRVVIAGTEDLSLLVEKSDTLQMISRVGIGLDGVPLAKCRERGIAVSWTPDAVTFSVAELTVGFMISWSRAIGFNDRQMRDGIWNRSIVRGLADLTVGLIGFGRIGKAVAELLLHLRVKEILVVDVRDISDEVERVDSGRGIISVTPLEQVIENSDVVSLHIPLWRDTANLIGRRELLRMRSDAYLINTSRGGIIDEDALFEAVMDGSLAGAALDVYESEPYRGRLTECSNIVLSPHSGSCSITARKRMEFEAAEEAVRFLRGEKLIRAVPPEQYRYAM